MTYISKGGKWVNLTPEHLEKELMSLKKMFSKIDEKVLEKVLKKNGGHVGKTRKEIFDTFDGVEEEKEKFHKQFPGARSSFQEVTFSDGGTGLVFGWDIRFDPDFTSDDPETISSKDPEGNLIKLQRVSQCILITPQDEEHYPNFDYFSELSNKGDSPYCEGEWGTDPNDVYNEYHQSNPKKLIPTRRELEAMIHNFNTPLLGKIPFVDTDNNGKKGIYQGINVYDLNGKKKKLPEGWTRKGGEEYNGLYYYSYKGGVQWKHP